LTGKRVITLNDLARFQEGDPPWRTGAPSWARLGRTSASSVEARSQSSRASPSQDHETPIRHFAGAK
jgi:hypothetical protein